MADQVDRGRAPATAGGAWYRPMVARPTDEEHRSATALELFFDLCFVVAVAQAASALHYQVAGNHVRDGVVGYVMVFFAIWWAWMNFTWFASAYDTDDIPYRLTTLVQIAGALVLAAGVPEAMDGSDFADHQLVVERGGRLGDRDDEAEIDEQLQRRGGAVLLVRVADDGPDADRREGRHWSARV